MTDWARTPASFGCSTPISKLIDGDFAESGVGPAARKPRADRAKARWAVVRPWSFGNMAGSLPAALPNGLERAPQSKAKSHIGSGRIRIIFNDWYDHDRDRDGLSDGVERELGTCSGWVDWLPNGKRCPTWEELVSGNALFDPRDSDGDGLTDAAEVLGSDGPSWQCPPPLPGNPPCSGPAPDADQTLPLWGADPLHKDFFLEIDTVPYWGKCPNDENSSEGVMLPSLPSHSARLGEFQPNNLFRFREIFAKVNAKNPNGRPGINVHFDIDLGLANYPKHGPMRRFDPVASDTYPALSRFDLVTVRPQGSTCGAFHEVAQAPEHLGYFRYAKIDADHLRGGSAGFGGTIVSGADAITMVHETGHHLGLAHGGPSGHSPYRAPGGDTESVSKLVQFSPMNYVYQGQGNADVFFPTFYLRRRFPIPNLAGEFVEQDPGIARDMSFLFGDSLSPAGNRSWGFAVQAGVNVDFNLDGVFDGVIRAPVEAVSNEGGAYTAYETTSRIREQVAYHSNRTSPCDCGGESCTYQDMLMAGSPLGVEGAGRIQMVTARDLGTLGADWVPDAALVVTSLDKLKQTSETPCDFRFDSCATAPADDPDLIRVRNSPGPALPISINGPWTGAAAKLQTGEVALAWSSAILPAGMHDGGLPTWSGPALAFAPNGDLSSPLTRVSLPSLPPNEGARVDAMAMAAWDVQGEEKRVVLVVRSALTSRLSLTTCSPTGCEAFALVRDEHHNIIDSTARPALLTRKRQNGRLELYLLVGAQGSASFPQPIRLFRRDASTWKNIPLGDAPVPLLDSSLSAQFTDQGDNEADNDRLVVSYERDGVIYLASTRPGTFSFVPQWDSRDLNQWAYTRFYGGQQFPGAIPTLFHANVNDIDDFLRDRVRMVLSGPGRGADCGHLSHEKPSLRFFASGAGEVQPRSYEYIEDSTIAWGLCAALGETAGIDLVDRNIPLYCPALDPDDSLVNVLVPAIQAVALCPRCPSFPCLTCPIDRAIQDIRSNPAWLARPSIVPNLGEELMRIPGEFCSASPPNAIVMPPAGFFQPRRPR